MRASACASPGKAEGGTGRPPPHQKKNKKQQRGKGGGRENSPQPSTRPPTPPEAATPPPPQKAPKTGPPKEVQGDQPAETGNTKPRTAAHREKGHRNMQTHTHTKKKMPAAQPEGKGMGGQGPQGPGQGHPAKKKSAKNTPRQPSQDGLGTAETRAQHARTWMGRAGGNT